MVLGEDVLGEADDGFGDTRLVGPAHAVAQDLQQRSPERCGQEGLRARLPVAVVDGGDGDEDARGDVQEQPVSLAGPAHDARAALAQGDTLRQAKASLIEQGDKAERKLNWLLRGRLADAIRDRALLPMWFVTVLGPVPPAHKTQARTDLATQVLAYGITDQIVALGPAPDEYVPRRTEWHRELTKDLRRW